MKKIFTAVFFVLLLAGCAAPIEDNLQLSISALDKIIPGMDVKVEYEVKNTSEEFEVTGEYFVTLNYKEVDLADEIVISEKPLSLAPNESLKQEINWDTFLLKKDRQYDLVLKVVEKFSDDSWVVLKERTSPVNLESNFNNEDLSLSLSKQIFIYNDTIDIELSYVNNSGLDMNDGDFVLTLSRRENNEQFSFTLLKEFPLTLKSGEEFRKSYAYRVSGIPVGEIDQVMMLTLQIADNVTIDGVVKVENSFTYKPL